MWELTALIQEIGTNVQNFTTNSHTVLQQYLFDKHNFAKAIQLLDFIKESKNDALLAAYINIPCRCGQKTTALHFAARLPEQYYENFKNYCISLITQPALKSLEYKNKEERTPEQGHNYYYPAKLLLYNSTSYHQNHNKGNAP